MNFIIGVFQLVIYLAIIKIVQFISLRASVVWLFPGKDINTIHQFHDNYSRSLRKGWALGELFISMVIPQVDRLEI